MTYRKKLIEVALPLEAINVAAAREKSIRHGHPSTLHLWWARRPLAACRAVLFGQLVDDPSSVPEEFPDEAAQDAERQRLFRVIEELVIWENSNNPRVLGAARREIARSVARWRRDRGEAEDVDASMLAGEPRAKDVDQYLAEKAPPVYDPFCGGGSIPLEAQRLGLRAIASDLNPVAVLITKALIEIPPKFAGRPPVNPESRANAELKTWKGAQGLAEDVRYYGRWMRDEAEKRIGHLYPKVTVTEEMAAGREDLKRYVGRELTVIAWLWARTVTCPNPACGATMPLVRSFWLSKKKRRRTWVEPEVEGKGVRFRVATRDGGPQDGTVERRGARCLCCESPVPFEHVRSEGRAGRMGQQLMAIALEGERERVYVEPIPEHERIAASAQPENVPETSLPEKALSFRVQVYGMTRHRDLFTSRQLTAITALSDLIRETRDLADVDISRISKDADGRRAYVDAIALYLAFLVDKLCEASTTICTWSSSAKNELVVSTFRRQALPMTWDFAEANILGDSSGSQFGPLEFVRKAIRALPAAVDAAVKQQDATRNSEGHAQLVSTDPPYYDNIGYADLSDFFYVWLRRSLREMIPSLFSTVLTPKDAELIASRYRQRENGKSSEEFFEAGLQAAFESMKEAQVPGLPITIFYAFKQEETDGAADSTISTGWDTMLSGLLKANLSVDATWPVRTERSGRSIGIGTNALASSILLACRPRIAASLGTRNEFVTALKRELPEALKRLQDASIAPVDLAQSAIGPGMAVFSRYAQVLEPDGTPMAVRTALGLINQVLDEVLAAEESEYDADTRWAITWFTQHGFDAAPYGEAETLSKARNTSVEGLVKAGILEARGGKVRLLRRDELGDAWTPSADARFTVWEACQHLIKALETGGEAAAADLLRRLGPSSSPARELAYRLYQHCERTQQAEEARSYNGLVVAWPRLAALATERAAPERLELDFGD